MLGKGLLQEATAYLACAPDVVTVDDLRALMRISKTATGDGQTHAAP